MQGDRFAGGEPRDIHLPRCAGCGEPIGVLEAAWLEDTDGSLRPSPAGGLEDEQRAEARLLWHPGCIELSEDA